ncbi:MAG: alpha-xylosidase [Anaerolineales bacterium]
MKFTDGYWKIRAGYHAYHPAEAYEVETGPRGVTVYAPTKPVRHRGDTLNGKLLTIHFSSPMPDVIRVRLTHWTGKQARPPEFEVFEVFEGEGMSNEVMRNKGEVRLASGRLAVQVRQGGEWGVEFFGDGKVITRSGHKGMGIIETDAGEHFLHEQLSLGVGECVYGLGERFTAFVKNGQAVDIWNEDGGTASEQAYKNIPFYLTNRGYGVFVNHPGRVSFEVASEKVNRVQFSVPDQSLEYFVIYGPTPKEVLEKYTALTGRPALPPAWSFGLWLSTSFTTSYDETTVTSIIEQMAARDLPVHVFHFDCFWMREFNWCDFQWDARTFPDPAGMLHRLKALGLKICVWINPYIAQRSPLFAEGMANGYLLKKPNGDVWQIDQWQPGMGIVDFTNPAAREWFGDKLRTLLDMGVDAFKTDFGERIPTDVVYFNGADPVNMHNFYTYLYNKTVFGVLQERYGKDAIVFARSATAGGQQFPVHWGGDCESTFEAMAESLRGGLSLTLSGFGFWSHDIGGFEGLPPAEIYKRWVAFGLLSSHSRLHGSGSYRVPWLYDEEAVDVLRFFTKLKCRLMPYLYAKAIEAHQTGIPMMRAMMLEFPDDPACETLDRQYMLGEALLVAPVFSADGYVTFYVPRGRWTNLITNEVLEGPGWFTERHGFMSLPLLVRPGSVIAMGRDDRPDYDFAKDAMLKVYGMEGDEITVEVPTLSGGIAARFKIEKTVSDLSITCEGQCEQWQMLFVGPSLMVQVSGGLAENTPEGLLVAGKGSGRVVLR